MNQKDERTWGTFVHLGGIVGILILPTVGNIIAVLVLWLIKRNESHFVDDQGKEAINFQITLSIITVIINVVNNISMGLWSLANFWRHTRGEIFTVSWGWHDLLGIIWLLNVIFSIIAAVRANNGVIYRYPLSLRLVK
ncbi:DUF4870 domain-containing protein [Chitinophaga nivalis]|uniref:DUF4870 domain-containing protein n=1 Tax=Chitinophaga nivalis TaxID=2991709 RepID=A0ABT3ILU1_9BACT|nr:DUF4870 domain-containing protein [Chitinophaga nivalis]MCW3465388.1 DUF4870 domain-containing protein [Chitinophaga nivalis]MCW3484920.1 DUF4870 domain-containing protein [Chitinophaga nivalis]